MDNRAGAGGAVGTDFAAKAEPDGYTLLVTDASALTVNPWLYGRLPYRAYELAAVAHLATFALVLLAQPSSPFRSLADVLAADRTRPGALNVATSGNGTSVHLALAMLNAAAASGPVHVPTGAGGSGQHRLPDGRGRV